MSAKEKMRISMQKQVVGHFIEKIPNDCEKNIIFVMQGDGIWEVRRTRIGEFYNHRHECNIPGLEINLEEGWALNVPKVPKSLLDKSIAFFKKVEEKYQSEAYLQFFYDTKEEVYHLHCPKQVVSGASVNFENDKTFSDPKYIQVLEVHSHSTMGAFFSGTDDNDEKEDRFYGVIGKITQTFPEMKFRLMSGETEYELDVSDIFDMGESEEDYPDEWINRIKKSKPTGRKGYGKGYGGYGKHSGYGGYGKQQSLFGGNYEGPFGRDDYPKDLEEAYESQEPFEKYEKDENGELWYVRNNQRLFTVGSDDTEEDIEQIAEEFGFENYDLCDNLEKHLQKHSNKRHNK